MSKRFPSVFAGERRLPLSLVVLCALAQAALAIVIAFQMRNMFSAFGQPVADLADLPWLTVISVMGATCGILALRLIEKACSEAAALDFVKALRLDLFNRLSRLPSDELQQHQAGSLQIRFVGDLSAIRQWVGQAIPGLVSALCLLPALVFILFTLSPYLALIGAALILLCIGLMHWLAPGLHPYHHNVRYSRGGLASFVAARLQHASYLRVLGLRKQVIKGIARRSERIQRFSVLRTLVVKGFQTLPEFTLQLVSVTTLLGAIALGMSAPQGAIIIAIVAIFQQPLTGIAGFWNKRHAYLIARRKCVQILRSKSMTSGPKCAIDTTKVGALHSEGIAHKTASFPAFAATPGQHLLFTGHSGTGKSTLLALISGLQKPRNGKICINDMNINQLRETDRRRVFYCQGAETVIFAGRFKSVLTFGCNHKIDASRLERAICNAGLEATVSRIGGWQAQVAENGQNLSATEILKVALCRLLLTRAKVVVVDDIDRFMANQDCRHGLDVLLAQKDKLVVATAHNSAPFQAQFTHIHALDKASVLPINAVLA